MLKIFTKQDSSRSLKEIRGNPVVGPRLIRGIHEALPIEYRIITEGLPKELMKIWGDFAVCKG